MLNWVRLFFLVVCIHAQTTFAVDSERELVFAINAPGSAPYLYFDEDKSSYQGLLVDFFEYIGEQYAARITYVDTSRARIEEFTRSGRSDMFLSSRSWLSSSDALLFSDAIISHNSYLYGLKPFSEFNLNHLEKSFVCTRHNFHYPVLSPYFKEKQLIRVDSSSQQTMATMLIKGRCDYVIMNEHNARAVFSSTTHCGSTFYQSPRIISQVDMSLLVNVALEAELSEINQHISHFIKSKKRQASLDRHSGGLTFPIQNVCE